MKDISIDFETRSTVDLSRAGAWRYAIDRTTFVLCLAWAVDGAEPRVWRTLEEDVPADLVGAAEAVARGEARFTAWNAGFECAIWNECLAPRIPALPRLPPEAFVCTMARALTQGWPGPLGLAAGAMKLGVEKDPRGPVLTRKLGDRSRLLSWPDMPALYDYCAQDVRVEQAIQARLVRRSGGWTEREARIEALDRAINARGMRVDVAAARAVLTTVQRATERANAMLPPLTGGAVEKATQAARILGWLEGRHVHLSDMRAETVERALKRPDLPDDARAVLEVRQAAGGAAVKKLAPMLAVPDPRDGRARGLLQYHGAAATGRWAGRLIQPQNMPRPQLKGVSGDEIVAAFVDGTAEARFGANLFAAASDALRPLLTATPGNLLVRADLSAIEARIVLWLAGHDDAMHLFRTGACIYCETATAVYGRLITKAENPTERQVGKVIVLGCGYQMGPSRFQQHAEDSGVIVTASQAEEFVGAYRRRWHKVPSLWWGLNEACLEAALTGGTRSYRGVDFAMHRGAMLCRIPSGRVLTWQDAQVAEGRFGDPQVQVKRMKEGRWETVDLYGGILAERVTQALARDVMADGMLRMQAEGLDIVLTVHDEVCNDIPEAKAADAEKVLVQCLTQAPTWAPDLPLAAEAATGFRYGK